jgi:hypothetical protein
MKRTTTVLESNSDSLGAAFAGLIRGSSSLAGVKAHPIGIMAHDCKGKNSCKGKCGCKSGDKGCKGKNSCKGKGGCKTKGKKS